MEHLWNIIDYMCGTSMEGYVWNIMERLWNIVEYQWEIYGIALNIYAISWNIYGMHRGIEANSPWEYAETTRGVRGITTYILCAIWGAIGPVLLTLNFSWPPHMQCGAYGTSMEYLWDTYGVCMDYLRIIYGLSMDYLLIIYGLPMDYLWIIYGLSMDYLWIMYS